MLFKHLEPYAGDPIITLNENFADSMSRSIDSGVSVGA